MNIILTGMPGCGKSSLGVIIAKILGMDFIDTDVVIQKNENKMLQDIINEKGVDAFLDIECENILKINAENSVIATGGSVVLREKAMNKLKNNASVVFIDISAEEAKRRLFNIETRGIAMGKNESIEEIYKFRRPYYLKYADFIIEADKLTMEEAIAKTVKLFNF